jgi:hypothetical protein
MAGTMAPALLRMGHRPSFDILLQTGYIVKLFLERSRLWPVRKLRFLGFSHRLEACSFVSGGIISL